MVPLLRSPAQNPYATLINLFMNAVEETMSDADRDQALMLNPIAERRLLGFLPRLRLPIFPFDAAAMKSAVALRFLIQYDHVFERYQNVHQFREAGEAIGARMKDLHTIIDKWPYRLDLRPRHRGAKEAFNRLMRQGVSGKERYVEWKRVE